MPSPMPAVDPRGNGAQNSEGSCRDGRRRRMDISARVTVLERVPLFNGLKPEEREAVAREAHERPLKKGDVLFQQGEEAAHNYVLGRSEEHTSELQTLMRTSYDVFCWKKKKQIH